MSNPEDETYGRQAPGGQAGEDGPGTSGDPEANAEQASGQGPRHASRRAATRRAQTPRYLWPRSVRAKIVSLLMVPVVSLMALWGFATVTTAQNVSELQQLQDVNATLLEPIDEFVAAVQSERAAAAQYLATDEPTLETLEAASGRTDSAVTELEAGIARSSTDAAAIDTRLPERLDALVQAAEFVPSIRARVQNSNISWVAAYDAYTVVIEDAFRVSGVLTQTEVPGLEADPRVALELLLAREMVARQDAAMSAAHASGVMTQAQYATLINSMEAGQALLRTDITDLRPTADAAYGSVLQSESYQSLRDLEATVERGGAGYAILADVPMDAWSRAVIGVDQQLALTASRVSPSVAAETNLFGLDVLGTSALAVPLGLAAVVISLLISVAVGRGLVVELAGLHRSAMDVVTRKLPATLRRLQSGQRVELDAEAPRETYGDDEISQVADAVNAMHRASVQAAIDRSDMVRGISGVYVYLARRSQVLLHRQLSLLDSMERRTEDPDDLEDLFRLDHLTTRMRRLAESLVILSGTAPARRWSRPVPLIDVVRAAIAEVEDFPRIEVLDLPDVRVAGAAVADLTHLVAELVENAAVFSPPNTKARVRGELVGTGLALEIEDRGLGMSREAMEDANRRIQDTDQIDLLETDQLGLFVVNRLSHRLDVEVTLQRSPYGGVTAIVLVPTELLEQSGTYEALPGSESDGQPALEQPQLAAVGSRSGPPGNGRSDSPGEGPRDSIGRSGRMSGAPPDDGDDLPRRVRQASLGSEMRRWPGTAGRDAEHDSEHESRPPRRTPEEARATFSALRTGWLRGQSDTAGDSPQGGQRS
ncbi:MAG: nitrate- and nitrite sensing domain-containing protein [Actinomycetota bacterium]